MQELVTKNPQSSPADGAPSRSGGGAFDSERLRAVIEPVVHAHAAELVDIELKNEAGWILRVLVEKQGSSSGKLSTKDAAINLELCANISRDLSPALDASDPIPHRYALEVSSPGVERPLKTLADFERFQGEKAKLKLTAPVAGQKVLVGLLGPVEEGVLSLEDGAKKFAVPLDDIASARLVFEFGPAKKPSSAGSRASKGAKKKKRKS